MVVLKEKYLEWILIYWLSFPLLYSSSTERGVSVYSHVSLKPSTSANKRAHPSTRSKEASPSLSVIALQSNDHPSLLSASSNKPPRLRPLLSGSAERRQSSPGPPPARCVHSGRKLTCCGSAARPDDLTPRPEEAGGGWAHWPANGS